MRRLAGVVNMAEDSKLHSTLQRNPPAMGARLGAFLHLREGEGRLVSLTMALMFVPSAGSAIGIASAESLFLSRVGADALPGLYIALGMVTIATTLGITTLLGRVAPGRCYLVMPLVLAILLGSARGLVALEIDGIYRVLWITVFLFDTLMRLALWGIAGLCFDTRQAKRLFPLLVASGILGVAVGGLLTGPLVAWLGTENLLLVWATLLLAALGLTRLIMGVAGKAGSTAMKSAPRRRAARVRDDLQAGFQYVRHSRLMRWIALSALLFQALYFLLAFPFSKAVQMHYPMEDEMTAFLGVFRGLTTGAALLVSLLVATRFNTRFGLMAGFLVLAAFDLLGFSTLAVWSVFMAIVAFRFLHEAWQSGVTRTAWFAQFNVVPPFRREQTRMFINGVCLQLGVVLVGMTLLVGNRLLAAQQLYIIGAVVAAFTVFAVVRAREAYLSALVDALRAGRPHVFSSEEDPFSSLQHDAQSMQVAIDGLKDPDASVRRVAADILSNLNAPESVPALVDALGDGDADVRIAVLPALARLQATSAWDDVAACLSDPAPEVRAAALSSLRRLAGSTSNFPMHAQPLLGDPAPAVRATAAVALLESGPHDRAEQTLREMCSAENPYSRVEALRGFGALGNAEACERAAAALADPEPVVRRAAAAALAGIDDVRASESLIGALGDSDPSVRAAIAASLGAIGLPVVERTVASLDSPALEEGALLALEHLPVDAHAERIRAYARGCVAKALRYHTLLHQARALARRNDRTRLLADALQYMTMHHGVNALRAIALINDRKAVTVAIDSLASADPLQRANAVETLDSIREREIARPVLRIWEPDDLGRMAREQATPEQMLHESLGDADAWLRACAALASDGIESRDIQRELTRLAQSDPDSTVRESAAAALDGDKAMHTLHTLSLMERILFLKRVPLFAKLPPAELKQVAAIAEEHLFADDEIIAQQNEPGDELYVIVSGQVRVLVRGDGEVEAELAVRGAGEYVGEMAVISQKPRMARLVAAGDVRALCIGQKQFEGILRERPETSLAVMRVLCDRLRERESAMH